MATNPTKLKDDTSYVNDTIIDDYTPVVNIDDTIIRPYTASSITIGRAFMIIKILQKIKLIH